MRGRFSSRGACWKAACASSSSGTARVNRGTTMTNIESAHRKLSKEIDQPLGALLKDLKQRGMFEDTLVIWGGEFGRTPTVELDDSGKAKQGPRS